MYIVIYCQANSESQDNDRQSINLKRVAEGKGWYVKKVFQEVIGRTSTNAIGNEFNSLIDYAEKTHVDAVMVSEMSKIGHRVADVINTIELLHGKGIAFYVHQLEILTFENGRETPITKILLQAMSIGAEMENNQRLVRQREGINLAQSKGVYAGRKPGAKTLPTTLLKKYKSITELIEVGELSVRAIARTTNHSINTVRKVKQLKKE